MLGWAYYKTITISDANVDADLADFPQHRRRQSRHLYVTESARLLRPALIQGNLDACDFASGSWTGNSTHAHTCLRLYRSHLANCDSTAHTWPTVTAISADSGPPQDCIQAVP